MSKPPIDKEAERVLSNPDNLILSDSLIGRIDFDETPPPETSVKFCWGREIISGRFSRYKIDSTEDPHETIAVSFICPEESLDSILRINPGTGCSLEILKSRLEGCLSKIDVKTSRSELDITVTILRYN